MNFSNKIVHELTVKFHCSASNVCILYKCVSLCVWIWIFEAKVQRLCFSAYNLIICDTAHCCFGVFKSLNWWFTTACIKTKADKSSQVITDKHEKFRYETSRLPLQTHASSDTHAGKIKRTDHIHTKPLLQRCFCSSHLEVVRDWGTNWYLLQQGLFRWWTRVTILTVQMLLGHLFINVPGCHPKPQHGRQRRVVQHEPDLRQGNRGGVRTNTSACKMSQVTIFLYLQVVQALLPSPNKKLINARPRMFQWMCWTSWRPECCALSFTET